MSKYVLIFKVKSKVMKQIKTVVNESMFSAEILHCCFYSIKKGGPHSSKERWRVL